MRQSTPVPSLESLVICSCDLASRGKFIMLPEVDLRVNILLSRVAAFGWYEVLRTLELDSLQRGFTLAPQFERQFQDRLSEAVGIANQLSNQIGLQPYTGDDAQKPFRARTELFFYGYLHLWDKVKDADDVWRLILLVEVEELHKLHLQSAWRSYLPDLEQMQEADKWLGWTCRASAGLNPRWIHDPGLRAVARKAGTVFELMLGDLKREMEPVS